MHVRANKQPEKQVGDAEESSLLVRVVSIVVTLCPIVRFYYLTRRVGLHIVNGVTLESSPMELPAHKLQGLAHTHVAGEGHIMAVLQYLLPQIPRNNDLLLTPRHLHH